MIKHNTLFSQKYIKDRFDLNNLQIPNIEEKFSVINRWKHEIETKSIYSKKEEQLQSDFLNDIFGKVLEYAYERGLDELNLEKEEKSKTDGTKPDGVLGYLTNNNKDIRAVIELKDAYTNLDHKQNRKNDNRTPVEQAFSYVSKCGGKCKWVIVSNFIEIRLYPANDSSAYQAFNIIDLVKEENLKEFYTLLVKDNLFVRNGNSRTDELLRIKIETDETITNEFYNIYKNLRNKLFEHIKENNPSINENIILTKSQKILDRIIFICFCEDLGLLPYKVFKEILYQTQNARFIMTDTRLWEEIKGLFTAIDQGYPQENINRFNGGLFKTDNIIDNLIIKDSILKEILSIEKYNFDSDLNVNILGHIFEQSITDLEELKASINGENFDKKQGKRKKDGVFYTPEYITRYIVSETIGSWLEDKKKELGYYELPKIDDEQWRRIKTGKVQKNNKTIKAHLNFWLEYREVLNNIKVLDPACGSGSFLVQVFDYLKQQRSQVNEEIATFEGVQAELFNQDTHILSHNIYGVDLNDESVEIIKLSLWLKTANKKDPLTALDNNIKCGNSLIDDVSVAGTKAFDWNKEFPEIMENGGFDIIVGNPPYGAKLNKDEKSFIGEKYNSAEYQIDTYVIFIEKSLLLLKNKGKLSFITPTTWLNMYYFKNVRNLICHKTNIELVRFFKYQVFNDVIAETCIFLLNKEYDDKQLIKVSICEGINKIDNQYFIKQKLWQDNFEIGFNVFYQENLLNLVHKIFNKKTPLKKLGDITIGIKPYQTNKGCPKQTIADVQNRIYDSESKCDDTYLEYIIGSDFNRYKFNIQKTKYIKYGNWLAEPRTSLDFSKDKIIIRQTSDRIRATIDNQGYLSLNNVHNLILHNNCTSQLYYILALLNSKLFDFLYHYLTPEVGRAFAEVKTINLERLPIVDCPSKKEKLFIDNVNFMLQKNKELQDKSNHFLNLLKAEYEISELSNKLLCWYELDWKHFTNELKKQKVVLSGSQKDDWFDRFNRVSSEIKEIQTTITETDKQIDSLVYKLYNLTDEEIKIIESVTS